MVREVRTTINQLVILDVFMTALFLFLAVYMLLALLNLFPIMAALPAVVYFAAALNKKLRINKMRTVEGKYSALNEKLRTAVDNSKMDNPVVNELQEEVMRDIKEVHVSSFVNTKSISYRIFLCVLLAFGIVFISTLNVQFLDLEYLLGRVPELIENSIPGNNAAEALSDVNLTDNIYGSKDIAVLGNEEINIKVKPSNFKVSVKDTGDAEQRQFDQIFPDDVYVEKSGNFEENIPVEEQELVQQYFNKVTG